MSNKWNLVSDLPQLEAGEVHLWRIDLANAAGLAGRYTSLLNASEQADANRRRIGQVRDHFILGRACSRVLIGSALGMDSSEVNIVKGIHGKPEIPAIVGHGISFNLSHSKETLLIALRRQGSVGVDVEYFDRPTDLMEVAQAPRHALGPSTPTGPEKRRLVKQMAEVSCCRWLRSMYRSNR